jgi:hypothetical protein
MASNMYEKQGLFFEPKNKKLANEIKIDTPQHFKQSIYALKKNGLTTDEKRSLVLARNRAYAIAQNPRVSQEVKKGKIEIYNTKLPPVTIHQKNK